MKKNIQQSEVLLNAPMMNFNPAYITPEMIEGVTHLRTFGPHFNKTRINGLYQYVSKQQKDAFVAFCKAHNLKVIWTLNMTTQTLQTELDYIAELRGEGLHIAGFQFGGEFWLAKYAKGQLHKKGVVEKVRIGKHNDTESVDYLTLAGTWVKAMQTDWPMTQYEYIMLLCEHGQEPTVRNEYRKYWNESVVNWVESNPDYRGMMSYSFHLYTGDIPLKYDKEGEINIVQLTPEVFHFMGVKPPARPTDLRNRWVVAEAAAYTSDPDEIHEKTEFYNRLTAALAPRDLFGIHELCRNTNTWHTLPMYDRSGITVTGIHFGEWLNEEAVIEEPPAPDEPTLRNVVPASMKGQFAMWGIEKLYFTDGSKYTRSIRWDYRLFGAEDIGKTKAECAKTIMDHKYLLPI